MTEGKRSKTFGTCCRKGLAAGLVLAALYWFAESLIHSYIWHDGGLLRCFLTVGLGPNEFWMRGFTAGMVIIFTCYIISARAYRRAAEETIARQSSKMLCGILPICAFCKKIRDPENRWHRMEKYISEHTGVQFTHGICPDCIDKAQ
ncbi:MAG: hypothetical protein HY894_04330 [Deltaproteobacteria bacterium]|nr:hypothetical protein [Deltaproteobacteria bacterium]